jgi:hypothetical protein
MTLVCYLLHAMTVLIIVLPTAPNKLMSMIPVCYVLAWYLLYIYCQSASDSRFCPRSFVRMVRSGAGDNNIKVIP